uniref:Uncharacterized protein n=1 Tax=viral metagenome TaxID=1070528 RepID=A0A6M3L2Q0_9ZZZZ
MKIIKVFCEIDDCINQSVDECSLDMIFIEGCRMCASFVGRKDQEKATHAEIDRVEARVEAMVDCRERYQGVSADKTPPWERG